MSAYGPKRTSVVAPHMSAFGGKADMALCENPLSRSLLGVKRTWLFAAHMSAYDPKRTSTAPHRLPEKRAHREQIRLTSLGLFKATQIWTLHRTQRAINAGIGGVGRSTTRWQTRSLRVHRARNCSNACSRLTAYPRSLNHGGLRSLAMITQNQGASIGACG